MINLLKVKNFKSHLETSIGLTSLNVLSGVNGGGKSSLMQSLLIVKQAFDSGALLNGNLPLNGDLISLGSWSDILFEGSSSNQIEITVGWLNGLLFTCRSEGEDHSRTVNVALVGAKAVEALAPLGGNVLYASADRLSPRSTYEMSDVEVLGRKTIGVKGEYCAHFLHEYGVDPIASNRRFNQDIASSLLETIEYWLGKIASPVRINVVEHSEIDTMQLSFSFESKYGLTNGYRPTNVGYGVSYALPVIVNALAAPAGSLLIVENPEAHLHPKAQTELTYLLVQAAKCGVQVFIETHSDHVLNAIRRSVKRKAVDSDSVSLHFFDRDVDEESGILFSTHSSPKIDVAGKINFWPKGFFDEFDSALDELM